MNWNILLIGTRAAVSAALETHSEFPMATAVAKYISFAADTSPSVLLETHGEGFNVKKLRVEFFTPLVASEQV